MSATAKPKKFIGSRDAAALLGIPAYVLRAIQIDHQLTYVPDKGFDAQQVGRMARLAVKGIDPAREYNTGEAAVLLKVTPRRLRAAFRQLGLGEKKSSERGGRKLVIRGRQLEQVKAIIDSDPRSKQQRRRKG